MVLESVESRFLELRRSWANEIADLIVAPPSVRLLDAPDLSNLERAALVIHAGSSHMLGLDESASAVPGFMDQDRVLGLVSQYWRRGALDARLARHTQYLWLTIFRLGRDIAGVRPAILCAMQLSDVGRHMQGLTSKDLSWDRPEQGLAELVSAPDCSVEKLVKSLELELDLGSGYLSCVNALLSGNCDTAAIELLTPLEVLASWPNDSDEDVDVAMLAIAGRRHHVYKSNAGGWPGPEPSDVPPWVRELVVGAGARWFRASSGHVPALFLVAETQEELKAANRWMYQPGFGVEVVGPGIIRLSIPLDFPESHEWSHIWWQFDLREEVDYLDFRVLIAIGIVRIEIYRLSPESSLEYVASRGFTLPTALVAKCRELWQDHHVLNEMCFPGLSAQGRVGMMALRERNIFDSIGVGMEAVRSDPTGQLALRFREYLECLDAATAQAARGLVPGDAHLEAQESFRVEVARHDRMSLEPLDLAVLGENRAYVQFRVHLDPPWQLFADVAVRVSGVLQVLRLEFSGQLDVEADLEKQSSQLEVGFSDFSAVLELGVRDVVVSPDPVIYNLPYHDFLFRLGFREVTYAHRVALLKNREATPDTDVATAGFSGRGRRHIKAVDTELQMVASIWESTRAWKVGDHAPRVLHLAGHGSSGFRSFDVALEIDGDEPPLSPAGVLLNPASVASEIVFLSACSTGRGLYGVSQIAEAPPMDVAFVEAGATVVVSTTGPVNDYIACLFASVFHAALKAGEPVCSAYSHSREAARTGKAPTSFALLSRLWPSWRSDVALALESHPNDWISFRLSGRTWS